MGIKGLVDDKEVDDIMSKGRNSKYTAMLDNIVEQLKQNSGKSEEIDVEDFQQIRNLMNRMKKAGCLKEDYKHVRLCKTKINDTQSRAFIRWSAQVIEPVIKKKKTAKKSADKTTQKIAENTPDNNTIK